LGGERSSLKRGPFSDKSKTRAFEASVPTHSSYFPLEAGFLNNVKEQKGREKGRKEEQRKSRNNQSDTLGMGAVFLN
jgi:hypothetical protein